MMSDFTPAHQREDFFYFFLRSDKGLCDVSQQTRLEQHITGISGENMLIYAFVIDVSAKRECHRVCQVLSCQGTHRNAFKI